MDRGIQHEHLGAACAPQALAAQSEPQSGTQCRERAPLGAGEARRSRDVAARVRFEAALVRAEAVLVGAAAGERSWTERVRAGLVALLTLLDEEPALAQLLIVDSLRDGDAMLESRQRAIVRLSEALQRERSRDPQALAGAALASPLVAEGLVGAVVSIVQARMLSADERPLVELAPALMSMMVLPYLGRAAAGLELARTRTAARGESGERGRSTSSSRPTYRTALVLRAIGCAPHSSNRQIAAAAEIGDEGQTSKLLRRLERQGLVQNVGGGQAYGEANAWLLTDEGRRVVDSHARAMSATPRRLTRSSALRSRGQL